MKEKQKKGEKERAVYDVKEKSQRIANANRKIDEGDVLFHKLKEIIDEQERTKLIERVIEKYRSAISEM